METFSGLLEAVLVLMLVTDERNSSSPIVRRDGVQMQGTDR